MKELKNDVKQICEGYIDEYDSEQDFIDELMRCGCQSGMIGELVYYSDTLEFYNDHKTAINDLLSDMLSDYGTQLPGDIFGDKWDSNDPLACEQNNQNLLAWFSFEEIARQLYN